MQMFALQQRIEGYRIYYKKKMATRRSQHTGSSFMQNLLSLLLASMLCMGLMPTTALADEAPNETFSVALTIIDSTNPSNGLLYNGKIDGMTKEQTVENLLESAGFVKGDQEASLADNTGKTFFESFDAPYFLGKTYDASTNNFWVTLFNGNGTTDYANSLLSAQLQADAHYQYVYGTVSSFAYSETIPDPLQVAQEPKISSNPEPQQNVPIAIDSDSFIALFKGIQASFSGTSDEWKALDLAACGDTSSIDSASLLSCVLGYDSTDNTALQRGILALTAIGQDASALQDNSENTINLIEQMANSLKESSTANAKMFALLAYESGPYPVPENALETKEQLINDVIATQRSDGGFAFSSGANESESDMTAMAIVSLAPYQSDPTVKSAINKALACLHDLQLSDGGFSSPYDTNPSISNASSTAFVIIALSALGIDSAIDPAWTNDSGTTPFSALLSQANQTNTGFLYNGADDAYTTEQGFRALVAYQGLKNTGMAYNIYSQAKQGQAGLTQEVSSTENIEQADSLPKTGEGFGPLYGSIALLTLMLLATGMFVIRCLHTTNSKHASQRIRRGE